MAANNITSALFFCETLSLFAYKGWNGGKLNKMLKIPELLSGSVGISDPDLLGKSHVPHLALLWVVKPGQLVIQRLYGTQAAL